MLRIERSRPLAVVLALALVAAPFGADAQPPKQKQREDLMDQLGLPKKKPKPKPPEPEPPDDEDDEEVEPPEPPPGNEEATPPTEPDAESQPAAPKRVTYSGRIRKLLASGCESCHASEASAGSTRFVITGALDADYQTARRLVDKSKPKSSALLRKAAGDGHGGGATFPEGSSKYETLLQWIEDGAPKGGSSSTAPAPKPVAPPPEPEAKPKPKPKPKVTKPPRETTEPEAEVPEASEPELAPTWIDPPPVYAPIAHQILQDQCGSCHAEAAFAGSTALSLTGDPARDYATARALVILEDPPASPLLSKARGIAHGGGATLDSQSADYNQLLAWIEAGALGPSAADVPAPSTEPAEPDTEIDATTGASVPPAKSGDRLGDGTPVPTAAPSRLPFSLPYHLRLNGRFDLSYERRDYKNHPFGPGRNALQTYHHFLFLSRSGADDPFGFNIEVLTQQFFEFNARFTTKNNRAKFLIKAGKILVPFGDEPLYHSSYGGKTGFDQELLPVIWSQPGIALNVHVDAGPVSFSNDTYAVQGYALRAPDGVLNLQGDFSTFDDFHFGVGDRLGISWAPLTAWYSLQVNPLGHDRMLLLQAFDFEFWRLRDVPFLSDLVVGFGAVRADVSGGGAGNDYYHFGSYGQLRYYPLDWLYIQYRWGLKTFDNRRGVYFDDTRMDERDGSSHNLSIAATWKGLYATVQMFWNLEKANEQDNDFLRFTVGYAF
jgi:hypothetical protein